MIVTVAAIVGVIAAVISIAAVVIGVATSHSQVVATAPAPVVIDQAATASVQIPESLPAVTAPPASATVPLPPTTTPPATTAPAPAPVTAPVTADAGLGVVVIDAGHEGSPPSGSEPIGPGSSVTKPKVESGASGVATHVDESLRNLQVALVLQKVLQARGVKVVMVRTTQNVKIANSERAQIANKAHAGLFIRLHCDSGPSSVTGILTLEPGKNWYKDHPIVAKSAAAAKLIHKATLAATGAQDRGITPRSDLSGFNWSQVPSVLVEMGMMSNPGEDRKLGTAAYQQKLADGMANGIVSYLKSR
jgi:N-acetylmuramoyl-L-alanine amidase